MIRKNILSGPAANVYLWDTVQQTLFNVGGVREESIKATVQAFQDLLQGGGLKQTGAELKAEMELMQTAAADISLYEGTIGNGCYLWLLSQTETFLIRDTDFTVGPSGTFSKKKAATAKLSFSASGTKSSDILWRMRGAFDPTGITLFINPALQKFADQNLIIDLSNYNRSIASNGFSGSIFADDKLSLYFDGVNDYLSITSAQFRGPNMIGNSDPNNSTFASGIGSWATECSGDTFAASGGMGKFTAGPTSGQPFMVLCGDTQSLVIGKSYHLQVDVKYQTSWTPGNVIFSIGGCTQDFIPTTSMQTFSFDFVVQSTDPRLRISCYGAAPGNGDILYIDNVILTTSSLANMNDGEMIGSYSDRDFENGTQADWLAAGNHTAGFSASGHSSSSGALKITSSGAGSQSTNYAKLASTNFMSLVVGQKYVLQFWTKIGTAAINVTAAFGSAGQSLQFTGLSTGAYTKCVFSFLAGANDVAQDIRLFLSATDSTGTLIDDVSLTAAYDFCGMVWFKKSQAKATSNAMLSRYGSSAGGGGYELRIRDDHATRNLEFCVMDTDGVTAVQISDAVNMNDNFWHCAAFTFDATGTVYLYRDGVQIASGSGAAVGRVAPPPSFSLLIGYGNSGNYYSGNIGVALLIRGKTLAASDVLNWYNHTKGAYGL
jgi:hypothetical protein